VTTGARLADASLPWLSVAGVLAASELLSRAGVLPGRTFPPVTDVLAVLGRELGSPALWVAVGQTLQGWALGLGIAAALAVPFGVVIGSSRLVYRSVRMIIEFLRPIPSVALIPLAILAFGNGLHGKVFLAAFASFWVVLVQAIYGAQAVDPIAVDTARSFGCSRAERLLLVTIPSALPYIATGLRMASSVALILAVTAELVIGSPGLGRLINVARSGGDVALMDALIVVTGLLGWLLNDLVARVERRVLHWHPAHRSIQWSAQRVTRRATQQVVPG
jgi:ABC-type nitrate/sulfonate/bicarbonate transport system permease component